MSNEATKSVEDPAISLGLLEQIETNSGVTQRGLSNELGIALGLVNLYIKRCIKKGWIKATQAPANRYVYYLTPTGLQEKSRLTAEYLSSSLNFFRNARRQMNDVFAECHAAGQRRVVLVGVSDLAEIAILSSHEAEDIEVVCIVDWKKGRHQFLGLPVVSGFADVGDVDVAIITSMDQPQDTYDKTAAIMGAGRVRAPDMLRLSLAESQTVPVAERVLS